jgi:hypothetical protein
MRYLEYADAAMIEHFAAASAAAPDGTIKADWLQADLEMMQEASRRGKAVFVKAWPAFARNFPDQSKFPPQAERARRAQESIEFPLAAFLAAAGERCYFLYTWGYRHQDGALDRFAEYDRRLGRPQGPAKRSGSRWRREFEYAGVDVDLAAGRGRIEWR